MTCARRSNSCVRIKRKSKKKTIASLTIPSQETSAFFNSSEPQGLYPNSSSVFASFSSRNDILSFLPFLSGYSLQSSDTPFVIDDLRKPFFVLQVMENMPGEEFTPPIFVFASSAFCSLVGYQLHELLGCPLSKVSFPDERVKRQLLSSTKSGKSIYLLSTGSQETPPLSFSDVISLSPLFISRNGRISRRSTRVQFFYNERGRVKWKICCIDGVEEGGIIEMPINWLPGLPKWWTTLPLSLKNEFPAIPTAFQSPRITDETNESTASAGDSSPPDEAFLLPSSSSSSFISASPLPFDLDSFISPPPSFGWLCSLEHSSPGTVDLDG